jgi:two-component system phosphate regulon sensor histidine kinase PhoR
VENAINTLKIHSKRESVRIKLTKPESPGLIAGDADELVQVFHNLIENALKYGGSQNNVQVSISPVDYAVGINGPALEIKVTDQGDGIAQEHIPRLTERFYRVDQNRSRKIGGTGLGLSIVKHILKRHRGRMTIQSELGVGSTFTVRLPRKTP